MSHDSRTYHLINAGTTFRLAAASRPVPALKPRDVLVRVRAVSLNYRDLLPVRGLTPDTRDGLIPLSDAAGTVVEVGSDVTQWKVGDRVAPTFFSDWQTGAFKKDHLPSALGGGQTDGVLSEEIVIPAHALVEIPAHLSFAEAATLPCAAVTAWHALFARGNLKAGETVLIQGTGGVALFALQLAVAHGAKAIVMSSSDEKLKRAAALGASHTINYLKQPEWDSAVLDVTRGEGVSHILELGGPDTFSRSIASVAAGGKIAQIGVLTGFGPTPNLLPVQFLNASIHGICVGSGDHFSELNRFLQLHKIKPVIDQEFDFDDVPAAYAHLESAKHFGKIVVNL